MYTLVKTTETEQQTQTHGIGPCVCCGGTGTYDEGYGPEECSCCSGTGRED